MKKALLIIYISSIVIASCNFNTKKDFRSNKMDSLKKEFQGKYIGITLRIPGAVSEPLTSVYSYTDQNKTDLAFKIRNVSASDSIYMIDPIMSTYLNSNDMILITDRNNQSGWIELKYIEEFREIAYLDQNKNIQ